MLGCYPVGECHAKLVSGTEVLYLLCSVLHEVVSRGIQLNPALIPSMLSLLKGLLTVNVLFRDTFTISLTRQA